MRYIRIFGGTHFCGHGFEEHIEFPDSMTNEEISEYAEEIAYENAILYEDVSNDFDIYRRDYDSDEEYEAAIEEATNFYYSEVTFDWKEVSRAEWESHNGYSVM